MALTFFFLKKNQTNKKKNNTQKTELLSVQDRTC